MSASKIKISFVCGANRKRLFKGGSAYRSAIVSVDAIELYNKYAIIDSGRTSVQSDPLRRHNSTFYKQIIKIICLYYVLERKARPIRSIAITQFVGRPQETYQILLKADLHQVVSKGADLSMLNLVDPSKAAHLLEETFRGRAVLYALTHLIKSLDVVSLFDRFERLWRAFNALYRALTKESTENKCHIALRTHIQLNPSLYPLSLGCVSLLKTSEIRSNLRWNKMILNNHPKVNNVGMLRDSIMRVEDFRILEIYRDSLPVREAHLNSIGALSSVRGHISKYVASQTRRDSDVLSTLCVKYMYFVRNKMAHAEKADHGFSFLPGAAEESEIKWLIPVLEKLVIDLVNNSDLF